MRLKRSKIYNVMIQYLEHRHYLINIVILLMRTGENLWFNCSHSKLYKWEKRRPENLSDIASKLPKNSHLAAHPGCKLLILMLLTLQQAILLWQWKANFTPSKEGCGTELSWSWSTSICTLSFVEDCRSTQGLIFLLFESYSPSPTLPTVSQGSE